MKKTGGQASKASASSLPASAMTSDKRIQPLASASSLFKKGIFPTEELDEVTMSVCQGCHNSLKNRNLFSDTFGDLKFEVKVSSRLVPGEASLLGLQKAVLCVLRGCSFCVSMFQSLIRRTTIFS
jgi:hypothetical protein